MKNINVVILLFILPAILFIPTAAHAGVAVFSARASVYNPPEAGASPSFMYGFGVDYAVNPILTVRGAAEYTSYTANGINYSLMPITLNLIAHFLPFSPVDPYLGAGVGLYSKTVGEKESRTLGAQALGGIRIYMGNFSAALEANYMIPDWEKSGKGDFSCGGSASGFTTITVPF